MRKSAVIIGYGRMGREHALAYLDCGIEVIGKFDRDSPSDVADYFHEADYVSVCTHDDSHAGYIVEALEAGCKVIAEKPLCLTEDDLKRIYKLATPETLYCNLPLLYRHWPDAASVGLIHANYAWGRADQIRGWRSKCPGYSFVLGAGVHMTSLLMHMKGRAIETVSASGQKNSPDIECETDVATRGGFVGGGQFELGILCGAYAGDTHKHEVFLHDTDSMAMHIVNFGSGKTAGIKRFIEGKYDRYHNSFAAHSVCFAIERALKSGKRETVEYLT